MKRRSALKLIVPQFGRSYPILLLLFVFVEEVFNGFLVLIMMSENQRTNGIVHSTVFDTIFFDVDSRSVLAQSQAI